MNPKNHILFLLFCLLSYTLSAQSSSVEKSTSGIQIGFLGVWYYNEFKVNNSVALRGEIGFGFDFDNFTIVETNLNPNTFGMAPVLTLEPRWYYNLEKRASKLKSIANNSGNFFSVRTSFYPNWFMITIPKFDGARVNPQLSIIPTWGIRRNLGKHFNYETGFGIGYRHNFDALVNKGSVDINLHIRIGYRF